MNTAGAARIGWLRLAVGAAMMTAPRLVLRMAAAEASGSMVLLTRTVGIRDLVIGSGTLAALRAGGAGDARRWVAAGLASDTLDALAGATSAHLVGWRAAALATVVAAPLAVADLWALSTDGESKTASPAA